MHFSMLSAGRRFHNATPSGASLEVFGQATNDFNDLLFDLYDGRGRPATRAARALVEHLINLCDVLADANLAERYLAHRALTPLIEAEAEVGLSLLKGREQKAEEHRLKSQARRHRQEAQEAIAKYGPGFRRSWTERNLYDRSRQYGHERFYHYYRLSSQVLHGASGGAKESIREIDGRHVHRSGSALALLPSAYAEGVRAFKIILQAMADATPLVDATEAMKLCDALLTAWPFYRKAVLKVDRALWPASAPVGPFAVLAVSRSGKRRWFCHEPELGLIVEAHPPDADQMTEVQRKNVDLLAANIADDMFADSDQWITIVVANVTVNPRPGAPWINAAAILVPDSFGRRLARPRPTDPAELPQVLRSCGVNWLPPEMPSR
ncbi:DUF5677 domain-containing protein [Micromonospora sp. ATA51]|uniref:DUF5677 domain-containing protein n=1 Tax=Micromonospora sp. ATA51 TaxID=2806098 RepID=UPI001A4418E7|nr:DUF5677 domain-containing protein [Micromonospora sp. ATA51]MBM0230227.1 hypothetical protein [Micromonospora sp. ATA51]